MRAMRERATRHLFILLKAEKAQRPHAVLTLIAEEMRSRCCSATRDML